MSNEVLHIGVSESDGARVLRLIGELDSYTSSRLSGISRTWINGADKIILNLDGLEYIDSAGLSVLVSLWLKAKNRGAQMTVSCLSPRVRTVFEITGLINLFSLDNSCTESKTLLKDNPAWASAAGAGVLVNAPMPHIGSDGFKK